MNSGKYRKRGPYKPYRPDSQNRDRNKPEAMIKKLDMGRIEEFSFILSRTLESLPDSIRGQIKGSVYAIASKKGVKEAKDYILKKHSEGIIDNSMEKKLLDLVYDYSKYR